ncbi:MAG: LysR family substrate-binding domain-containing protein, partial [Thermaceae bacterium]
PAGEVLYREGQALLQEAQSLVEKVRQAGQQGVRIGVPENLLLDLFPLLNALRKALGVPVEVLEMHTPDQVLALKEKRLEYGLAGLKVEEEGIAEEPLLDVPFYLALPEGHPLAKEEAVELGLLREENFILMPKEALPPLYQAFMELFKEAGFQPKVVREAARFPQGISLVAAGVGVYPFLAPYRYLPHPGTILRPLLVGGKPPGLRVSLIYRQHPPPPHLEAVRKAVKGFLEGPRETP